MHCVRPTTHQVLAPIQAAFPHFPRPALAAQARLVVSEFSPGTSGSRRAHARSHHSGGSLRCARSRPEQRDWRLRCTAMDWSAARDAAAVALDRRASLQHQQSRSPGSFAIASPSLYHADAGSSARWPRRPEMIFAMVDGEASAASASPGADVQRFSAEVGCWLSGRMGPRHHGRGDGLLQKRVRGCATCCASSRFLPTTRAARPRRLAARARERAFEQRNAARCDQARADRLVKDAGWRLSGEVGFEVCGVSSLDVRSGSGRRIEFERVVTMQISQLVRRDVARPRYPPLTQPQPNLRLTMITSTDLLRARGIQKPAFTPSPSHPRAGIGASSAIFSVVNASCWPPIRNPDLRRRITSSTLAVMSNPTSPTSRGAATFETQRRLIRRMVLAASDAPRSRNGASLFASPHPPDRAFAAMSRAHRRV